MFRKLSRSWSVSAVVMIVLGLAALAGPAAAVPAGAPEGTAAPALQRIWSWLEGLQAWWSGMLAGKAAGGETATSAAETICTVAGTSGAGDSSGAINDPDGCS